MQNENPELSIVIPVKDESDNILLLANEIDKVLEETCWTYEVLWINDGSTDSTKEILNSIVSKRYSHVGIHLPNNFGQSAAMWLGFQYSRGKVIVTMDGDGQNNPSDIPLLARDIFNGTADVSNGYRETRQDSFIRKISSIIANKFRNLIFGYSVRDTGCTLRAIHINCVNNLPLFKGMHRFLPVLFLNCGYKINEKPVNHRPRKFGKTKYSIRNRFWVGIYDILGMIWIRYRGLYYQIPHLENNEVVRSQSTSLKLKSHVDDRNSI